MKLLVVVKVEHSVVVVPRFLVVVCVHVVVHVLAALRVPGEDRVGGVLDEVQRVAVGGAAQLVDVLD